MFQCPLVFSYISQIVLHLASVLGPIGCEQRDVCHFQNKPVWSGCPFTHTRLQIGTAGTETLREEGFAEKRSHLERATVSDPPRLWSESEISLRYIQPLLFGVLSVTAAHPGPRGLTEPCTEIKPRLPPPCFMCLFFGKLEKNSFLIINSFARYIAIKSRTKFLCLKLN